MRQHVSTIIIIQGVNGGSIIETKLVKHEQSQQTNNGKCLDRQKKLQTKGQLNPI